LNFNFLLISNLVTFIPKCCYSIALSC